MPGYKYAQQFAVDQAAEHVREALMMAGEQVITIHTYTVVEDEDVVERCHCFDDIYKQTKKFNCPDCYGTTFVGGVKAVYRAWAIFSDNVSKVEQSKRGQWNPEDKQVQLESFPTLQQGDFIGRVINWNRNYTPAVLGDVYTVGAVAEASVRTGARYFADSFSQIDNTGGNYQVPAYDRVGQTFPATLVTKDHPIYTFPLLNRPIPRYDGLPRG